MGEHWVIEKNNALCRNNLDLIPNGNFISKAYEECPPMCFFKINGVTRFWKHEQNFDMSCLLGNILNSFVRHSMPFAYVLVGNKDGIAVYIGTLKIIQESVKKTYESLFPGIDIEIIQDSPLQKNGCGFGGIFTGIPNDRNGNEKCSYQIDNICQGMQGKNFIYVVLASGISNVAATLGHERVLEEMNNVFPFISRSVSGGTQGNLSVEQQNFNCKNYFENLNRIQEILQGGITKGLWRVNGYFASDNQVDAKQLGNIIKASFSGQNSKPEPFRVIEYNHIQDIISNSYFMAEMADDLEMHPVGRWKNDELSTVVSLYVYKYQTLLNSDQVAMFCQLPTKEFSGFYIDEYVEFDVSNRGKKYIEDTISLGDICVVGQKNKSFSNNVYLMEKNDFTRHALIIGITGGGKTNTSKSILNTLWNGENNFVKTPFLVIESAKREYWEMRNIKGFEELLIFTLGAETTSGSVKYRINPFETLENISLQTHIDYLLSTFKAAFDLQPPLPYILENAVYEIYNDRGWDIIENINRYGMTEYPTLSDLYNKIDVLVDKMGYHQEVQSNVKTALLTRVHSLMIGGKGAMLNTPKSVPIGELLNRPVVMELEDLGDDEIKSFVIGLLLVQLYEYRKSQMTKGSKELSHVLMIEEAHRLLKKVTETEGGNTRAKSVEFFCNMLAEIRTYGQGIIIADQIPTKLASDTIKNTNLKIVHRTVALEDRETIGYAMNMNEEQIAYLSSLKRGYAAVYAEGDNRPKCVKFPLVETFYKKERNEVLLEVNEKLSKLVSGYDVGTRNHIACSLCEHRCMFFSKVSQFIDERIAVERVLDKWRLRNFNPRSLEEFLNSKIMKPLSLENSFEKRCVLGYVLGKSNDLSDGQQQEIMVDYLRYTN